MSDQIKSGLSRRTLAKGAAWAAPAVVVASAAPMVSASPCEYTISVDPSRSCKKANANNYRLVFAVTAVGTGCANPANCSATITRVYERTGQGRTLWSGAAVTGEAILICNARNMASSVYVDAQISCQDTQVRQYTVAMPSFPSTSTCTSDDFCPQGAGAAADEATAAKTEATTEPEASATP